MQTVVTMGCPATKQTVARQSLHPRLRKIVEEGPERLQKPDHEGTCSYKISFIYESEAIIMVIVNIATYRKPEQQLQMVSQDNGRNLT